MSQLKLLYRNILESGTLTVTSENASFPKYRLYDRDIGLLFKGNSTPANFYINVVQSPIEGVEPTGSEIILNPGFETLGAGAPDIFADWTEYTGGASVIAEDNANKKSGVYCAKLTVDGSGSIVYLRHTVTLEANATYRFSFWYKNSASGKTCRPDFRNGAATKFLDDYGVWHTYPPFVGLTCPNATNWAKYSVTFTASEGTSYYLFLAGETGATSSDIYFDDVSIKKIDDALILRPIDRIIIPAGHNLDETALKLQYSTDDFGADINDAASWTQSGAGLINQAFTEQTKRFWRLNIASPAFAPEIHEMFLGKTVDLTKNPDYGGPFGMQENIERWEAESGLSQRVKNGEMRRRYRYDFRVMEPAQKTEFETWRDACSGRLKPFYLCDVDGNWVLVERTGDLMFVIPETDDQYSAGFELLEVLP